MKKFLSFWLVGVLGVLLLMPSALAATKVKFECDKNCTVDADGMCTKTCTFGLTGNTEAITEFEADIKLTPADKVQFKELKLNDGWTSISDDNLKIHLLSLESVSDADINFGSFTVTMPQDTVGCSISFTPKGLTAVEQTLTPEKQPSTGVTLPIIVLTCGLGVAFVTYYITKKNTKMFKI